MIIILIVLTLLPFQLELKIIKNIKSTYMLWLNIPLGCQHPVRISPMCGKDTKYNV